MKILNIGSMNIDYVYSVDHIILPGETESTGDMNIFLGGKGMNQSIALAKAGALVYHAGLIGSDGQMFLDACQEYGVNSELIKQIEGKTGHTIIQVDKHAQNSILLYGGANQQFTEEYIDEVISYFSEGDLLLLQNEVNLLPYIIDRAYEQGMKIVLNPSPFNEKLDACDLGKISLFLLNEVEGEQLTGEKESEAILNGLRARFPHAEIVLTLGKDGAIYCGNGVEFHQPIFEVQAVDTTAAGDTFTGYFLAGMVEGLDIPEIMRRCAKASSITVTRPGAVASIPFREEVEESLRQLKM